MKSIYFYLLLNHFEFIFGLHRSDASQEAEMFRSGVRNGRKTSRFNRAVNSRKCRNNLTLNNSSLHSKTIAIVKDAIFVVF